ncbi:MAG: pyruvate ferredoxin oxidoreductase [Desulfurococcales archaeon]|nr:pyruvate ferredoxin oxidoreductase [Desulfurococcales archaeon]
MPVKTLTGNKAVAYAARLARVKVVSAYPITPQTTIVETLASMIEHGEMDAKMIRVESEHSALAAALGAASAGVRAFTATSSHGLLYMHEVVWWTAGARVPLVMAIVTRAIGPPWNIHVDHQDIWDQRDSGWLISIAESNQEVFDLTVQAFRISEDERVYLPMMVGLDGFILSHTVAPVDMPEQHEIDEWLPERKQPYVITPETQYVMGNLATDEDYYMMRYSIQAAMEAAKDVIKEVDKSFGENFGRSYGGLVERYRVEDAKYHVIVAGSWAGDAKEAVNILRDEGYPVGLLRVRFFRPWPTEDIVDVVGSSKGVITFDRSVSFGARGHLFMETISSLGPLAGKLSVRGVIAGLGGVDVPAEEFAMVIREFIDEVEREGQVYDPAYWHLPSQYRDMYPSRVEEVVR